MYSCLLMKAMMVNMCCKFQSNISNGFEIKWGGTKNLIKILSRKRDIILTKTLTELCSLKSQAKYTRWIYLLSKYFEALKYRLHGYHWWSNNSDHGWLPRLNTMWSPRLHWGINWLRWLTFSWYLAFINYDIPQCITAISSGLIPAPVQIY